MNKKDCCNKQVSIIGKEGDQGPIGPQGQNQYLYIRYATDNIGSGFSSTPSNSRDYIGILQSSTPLTPSAGDFAWIKYQGDDGTNGTNGTNGTSFTGESHTQFLQYNLGDIVDLNQGNSPQVDLFSFTITAGGTYYISFTGTLEIISSGNNNISVLYSILKNGTGISGDYSIYKNGITFTTSQDTMAIDTIQNLAPGDVINIRYTWGVAGVGVAHPRRRRLNVFKIA